MKQFIRYLSLIACVVVVGVWGWSGSHEMDIGFGRQASNQVRVVYGKIVFQQSYGIAIIQGFWFEDQSLSPGYANDSIQTRFGISLPYSNYFTDLKGKPFVTSYYIPIWLFFVPLMLLTLKLWYHPLKAWWRGTGRQGFEVEVKTKSKDHGRDAHATDQSA